MVGAALRREVGVGGATVLGLGSMLGSGVFVAVAIVIGLVGSWAPLAFVLAGALATCNALSSAQLAAAHPVAGGTYEYGYRLLHPAVGFSAGWLFLIAKSASAATAAMACGGYLLDLVGLAGGSWLRVAGWGMVVVLTVVVITGLRRSAAVNVVLVGTSLSVLAIFVGVGLWAEPAAQATVAAPGLTAWPAAVAVAFVAFTGYGRIATLGEEIRDPVRNIPRAVAVTVSVCVVTYAGVAWVLQRGADHAQIASALDRDGAPLTALAEASAQAWLVPVLTIGALAAMGGTLLNLLLGLSRVWLAMGRRGDMPQRLGRVDDGRPTAAILVAAVVIAGLVGLGDLRIAWSVSAITVLGYYSLTNLCALRLSAEHRRYPRVLAWAGLLGCLGLAPWVPWPVAVGAGGALALGLVWHWFRAPIRRRLAEG